MKKHSDETPDWEAQRNRIIGLGETSIRKSYYPELQQRIQELEKKNRELQEAYAEQTATQEELRQQFDETCAKEKELRESEERFHSLYTNMIEGAALHKLIYDENGVPEDYIIVETNPAFEKHLGISRDNVIGKTSREAYGVTNPPYLDLYARVVMTGKPEVFETYFPPLDKHFSIAVYCPAKGTFATIFEDITERKRVEEIRRESEEFLLSIVENIPLMLFVKDAVDLRFVRFNRAGEELLGYSREELVGKNDYDFFDKEQADFFTGKDREVLDGKVPLDIPEEKIETRNLGNRILHTKKIPVLDLHGDSRYLLGISEDITERKRAEEDLYESEERFAAFMDHLPITAFIKDEHSTNIFINRRMEEVFGAKEWIGKSVLELFPKDAAEKMIKDDQQTLRDGYQKIIENLVEKNGDQKIFETYKFRIDRKNKSPLIGGFAIDITEQKRAEDALRTSEERYRSLVDITDTGYLVLDNCGLVIDANEVYIRLTGRASLDDLKGRPVTEWTAPYDLERNTREVEKCIKTGHVRGLEIDYIKPDGTIQPIEINATTFHTGKGDVILTLCRDISERKQTNVALQQAWNKLSLLNAVTFQDIQTAAFSLSAYQELVRNLITDTKAKSYLEKQQMFLKKMVDTLDFAKNYQEMGMHPPQWQNVRQVFLYAISHLDFLHMKQNLQLYNLEIFADPLFEKALFNIMGNVLSHGVSANEVILRYEEKPDHLLLLIMDNGIGIPTEEKNMIFDRGYGKGTGLGLFLVREVLSITGMTIKETGIPGKGTRFEISVPKGMFRNNV
jgi:PAS domain S-box-containing protein